VQDWKIKVTLLFNLIGKNMNLAYSMFCKYRVYASFVLLCSRK